MTTTINASICPLCQQLNRCNVKASTGCWCMKTKMPAALLAQVPTAIKNKRCICNSCIEQYYQDQSDQVC